MQHVHGPVGRRPRLHGDLTVGRKTVVGTLKLTSTSVGSDPFAKLGGEWNLLFTVGGTKYELWRALSQDGTATSGMTVGDKAVKIPAPKVASNAITWTVPRSAVKSSKPVCGAYGWTYNFGIGVDYGG